jgi:hypothetical protein
MRSRLIPVLAALTTALAPAAAQADTRVVVEKNNQLSRDFSGDECGFAVAEHYDIRRTVVEYYDDGQLTREVLNIKFTGTATNVATGGSLPVNGTRRLVFDYEAGTFTETGVLRRVTVAGEGIVLHESGRVVEDLDIEGLTFFSAGPHQLRGGELAAFCGALANS